MPFALVDRKVMPATDDQVNAVLANPAPPPETRRFVISQEQVKTQPFEVVFVEPVVRQGRVQRSRTMVNFHCFCSGTPAVWRSQMRHRRESQLFITASGIVGQLNRSLEARRKSGSDPTRQWAWSVSVILIVEDMRRAGGPTAK